MTFSISDAPNLLNEEIKKVYIKDGRRKMMSSDGYTYMPQEQARKLFGNYKGGKYSLKH